ncbi:MAG: GerAB/ArcD/ProY family transporter [Peptococcales bacterium]|jgi:spore germination protein KB
MQLEGGRIDNIHLIFLIMGVTFGSSVIISPGVGVDQNSWLAVLIGLVGGVFFAYIFFSLAKKFPNKTLMEINDFIYGKFLGKIVSILYLSYFSIVTALVLRNFSDFLTITIYQETPAVVLIGSTVLISASAVRNGIEVITRCSLLLVPITLFSYLILTIFLHPQMDLNNLLPIHFPFKNMLKVSFKAATFPFGETVVFLMVIAYLNKHNLKSMKKFALSGIILPGIVLLIASARNVAVLGATMELSVYSALEAVELINVGEIFTRLEILYIFSMFSVGFIKVAVFYYAITLGTAQLLGLRSYLPLVLPIGVSLTVLSITIFESVFENILWNNNIYPLYALPFQFLIPLVTLILARTKSNKEEVAGEIT